jgi:hypothetical protein
LQRPFPFVPDIKDAGVADKLENYLRVHMSKISELDVGFCFLLRRSRVVTRASGRANRARCAAVRARRVLALAEPKTSDRRSQRRGRLSRCEASATSLFYIRWLAPSL